MVVSIAGVSIGFVAVLTSDGFCIQMGPEIDFIVEPKKTNKYVSITSCDAPTS